MENPLKQELEQHRKNSEDLLNQESEGKIILNPKIREKVIRRAQGLLPESEAERFSEILAGREWTNLTFDKKKISWIDEAYGLSTALLFGLLLIGEIKEREGLINYAKEFDDLFLKIISADPVLTKEKIDRLEDKISFLTTLHRELAQYKKFFNNRFLLQDLLDYDSPIPNSPQADQNRQEIGFVVIDALILARLKFKLKLISRPKENWEEIGHPYLLLLLDEKPVYWSTSENIPLSFIPLEKGTEEDIFDLFAYTYYEIGKDNLVKNNLIGAHNAFLQALNLKPEIPEFYSGLGKTFFKMGHLKEAIEMFQTCFARLKKEGREQADVHYALGTVYFQKEEYQKAIDAFNRALALRANYPEVYNSLGMTYSKLSLSRKEEFFSKAVDCFKAAVQLNPEYWAAYFNLGNLYYEQGQKREALEVYKSCIRIKPDLAKAYYNLGILYYEMSETSPKGGKDLKKARRYYEKAVKLEPNHAGAWHNLGIVYRELGLKEKAVRCLEKAIQLNPNLLK